ncbi:MAG: hypothetical protein BAJATHORv1_30187 [Candidatus Thorarchaeota archaeon]|nr:MAG: hypothetical protein BAJATHORv1_30187 [Candidatus Thorarchaeota archaeon]
MVKLEERLEEIVSRSTYQTARKEWISSQIDHEKPLYNYRLDHVKEVVRVAKILVEHEDGDKEVVIPAAWLHDVAKPGLGGVKKHGIKSAEKAREILKDIGISDDLVEKITVSIAKHVGLFLDSPLDPLEAQILWEADKLVKLGSTGLIHYFINSIKIWPGRTLSDIKKGLDEYTITARKIASSMHTTTAKEMAKIRLQTVESFVTSLSEELGM